MQSLAWVPDACQLSGTGREATAVVLLVNSVLLHRSIASTLTYTERDDERLRTAIGTARTSS
jgi:hypothetical protein